MDIYVPRSVVESIVYQSARGYLTNPCVCVKFNRKEYEVSLSLDSSLGKGDLRRADIRVYKREHDVTDDFMKLFPETNIIVGSIDNLMKIINYIDSNE